MSTCCNPFGLSHSRQQNRGAKVIPDLDRCRLFLPTFPWAEGQRLCVRCRMKLLKDYERLQVYKVGVGLTRKRAQSGSSSNLVPPPVLGDDENEQTEGQDARDNDEEIPPGSVQDDISEPSAPTQEPLYPQLPQEPCTSAQARARVYPPLPQEPSSSAEAIQRQLPYNPDIQTPTGSVIATPTGSGFATPTGSVIATPTGSVTATPTESVPKGSSTASSSDQSSSDESKLARQSMDLNRTLQDNLLSPIQPSDISRPNIVRRKIQKLKQRASDALRRITGVEASPHSWKGKPCVFCNKLLTELSEKFKTQNTKADKYKVLTSIPKRFSIAEVQRRTGCTEYMARKANALRNLLGAFSWPPPKHGKPMDPVDEELIVSYYNSNDNSRASPNETILVKMPSGKKDPIAKRRLLHNLNDLYQEFRKEHPNVKVSISKFQKLRPRNCIWPGLRGYHITCVCEHHQNFEFLLEAVDCGLSVEDFVKKLVCENEDGELREECHIGVCGECPKTAFLDTVLQNALKEELVNYTQWVRTDSTEIKNITISADDFKNTFYQNVPKIVEHDYITRKQKAFIKNLRDKRVKEMACITIQVDFAQNYSFIVQNAVQGFHWNNKQATVHPFVVHYWDPEKDQVCYKTYCIISDEMQHDADAFHVFLDEVMKRLKIDLVKIPITKVYYVSDGCGGQYKNVKNFANLMLHKEDYGFDAEWHFCATCHGKSTCDAISAVCKCATRRESLVRNKFITEVVHMFNFCEERLTSPTLEFIHVTTDTVAAQRPILAARYQAFKPIKGTRKHHAFIPKADGVMSIGRTSDSQVFTDVDFKEAEVCEFNSANVILGSYYAFFEAGNYHVGMLVEEDSDEGDIKLQVLKINRRTRAASWPEPLVFVDVPFRDVLMKLKDLDTKDGKAYEIDKDDLPNIRTLYNIRKTQLVGE